MPSLVAGDVEILKFLAEFVHLKPSHLAELTGRNVFVMRRRLRSMVKSRRIRQGPKKGELVSGRGYVDYLIDNTDKLRSSDKPETWGEQERVYFLTQKGWTKALELGFIRYPVASNDEKSNQNLDHDLKLTEIHLALWRNWGAKLHWYQYRPFTYVRFGKGEDDVVNADAFYWLDKGDKFPARFVEVENRRESHYLNADSSLIRKLFGYEEFSRGYFQEQEQFKDFSDFNVEVYRLADTLCRNLAKKARERDRKLNTRRFWIAPIPKAIAGEERIYITPKDYEQAAYSLNDA